MNRSASHPELVEGAIGFGRVGPCEDMAQAESFAGFVKGLGAIA